MDLSGNQFIYDGVNSNKYDLRFMEINTSRFMQVAGPLEHQTTFLNAPKRRVINGVVYSNSSPEFDVEIISENPISIFDRREIENWLFYQTAYKKLYVNPVCKDEGEVIDLPYYKVENSTENFSNFKVYPYVRCVFTNPVAIEYASGLHGWQCTCCMDSPFATLDAVKVTVPSAAMTSYATGLLSFSINVDSDMKDYLYPLVYFKVVGGEEYEDDPQKDHRIITWINKSDNEERVFQATEFTDGADVYCNSETIRFNNSTINPTVNYYNQIEKRNFPRLIPGENQILVSTDIDEVTITWSNKRWFM